MRGALFTVMPSECYEGQPYGALESMAVGTPLVASRLGGLAEIVEDGVTGVLVPPGDPTALAAAMRDIWADEAPRFRDGGSGMDSRREIYFAPETQIERLVLSLRTSPLNSQIRSGFRVVFVRASLFLIDETCPMFLFPWRR